MRALWLRIGLALALATTTSCNGSIQMDSRFVTLHNTMAALGMTQSGSISEGSLPEGGEAHFDGRLEPGQCYTVVGLGGGGVANLDVVVTDEAGNDVAHDATMDGEAAVQFCPQYPANYRISVRMQRGSGGYLVTSWSGAPGGAGGYGTPTYPTDYGYAATAPARPAHGGPGTCDAPYTLTTTEAARGDTTDGDAVITGSCIYGGTAPEHVYQFTVEQRSLVRAVLNSTYDGALYFEAVCGDARAELVCNDDAPTTSRSEIASTLEPGLYYLVVDGYGSGMGQYEVSLSMMAMRSIGEVCGSATPLTPGTTVAGTTANEANYFEATCAGQAQSPDRVYTLDVTQRSRVRVRMQSSYDGAVYLRSSCADASTELACNDDYQDTRHSLATATLDPGHYFVYADGFSTAASGDYSLTADLVPATGSGAPGDTCAGATVWAPGADLTADTFTMGDDATGSCGGGGAPDAVYRLNLTSRSRVRASFTSAEFPPVVYLQRTCGDQTSEVFCLDGRAGSPIDQTLAAGTYYLVVDGADQNAFGAAAVHVQVDDMGALEASCRAAPLLRPGHQVTGTTVGSTDRFQATCAGGAASPDLIYRLQIRRRSTVRITSEQTDWDGAIYVRSDCTDQTSELACNDDAGDNRHSMLETELDPGTYFVFVDGFASANQGAFSLDVDVQTSAP
jgi:hypothetical protein